VRYNAYDKAKKIAHRSRKAKLSGNADVSAARFDRPFSAMFSREEAEESDRRIENLTPVSPDQEARVEQHELIARVYAMCINDRERHLVREAALAGLFEDVLALDEDALGELAHRLYDNPEARVDCRLGSEASALRAAVDAAAGVAQRVAQAMAA
jgi:hypothetical protein